METSLKHMATPSILLIAGAVCMIVAAAQYPKPSSVVIGGRGQGMQVSAAKQAEMLDRLAQHGYSQLAPYADEARKDAQDEKKQKLFCWAIGFVGVGLGIFGLGDAMTKTVRWRRRARLVHPEVADS